MISQKITKVWGCDSLNTIVIEMERTNYDFYNITTKIQEGNLRKQTKNKQLLTIFTTINNRTQGMKKISKWVKDKCFPIQMQTKQKI